jgi:potassium-transporting ATPase KdpC subunit
MQQANSATVAGDGPLFRGLVRPAILSAGVFMVVTGLAYPLLTTGVAQILFPVQSKGSLIEHSGQMVGSAVIGQNFTGPNYFHPRPSATVKPDPADPSKTVDEPYNAALSGASNQGATSKKLIDAVTERVQTYRKENGLADDAPVPVDAVTASGSGLDPDISIANARLQAARVAAARNLTTQQVQALIDEQITSRQFGVLGEPRVNVLKLNLALDASKSKSAAAH